LQSIAFNMQNRSDTCREDSKDQIVNQINQMVISEPESKQIEKKLRTANKCYREKLLLYDKHEERHQEASLDLLTKKQLLDAHHEAVQMFDEQMALNKKLNNSSNFLHEEGSLKENSGIIAKRLKTLHLKQEELTKEIRCLRASNQDLETEMLRVKGEAMSLQEECDKHKTWLEGQGVSQEEISRLLKVNSSQQQLLHENSSLWLLPHVNKAEAESLLESSQSGTFLIRWENKEEQFVLSIKFESQVWHCLVERGQHGYGFAEPYKIHGSLMDLVAHYAEHSLEEHRHNLNTKLILPVGKPR